MTNVLYVYALDHRGSAYRITSSIFILSGLLLLRVVTGRGAPAATTASPPGGPAVAFLALAAVWAAVMLPLIQYPFLCDDYMFLERYHSLADALQAPQFFRPGFFAIFAGLNAIGQGSPVPFHLAAFALHLASAGLVYSLGVRVFASPVAAFLACALFLLNPLQLEAVLWPSGLQDLLWSFFMLAAIRCYVGAPARSAARLAAVWAFVAAALICKETATCFALLLPAVDLCVQQTRPDRRRWLEYAGFLAGLGVFLVIRAAVAPPTDAAFFQWPSLPFVRRFLALPYATFSHPWNIEAIAVPGAVHAVATVLVTGLAAAAVLRRALTPRALIGPAILLLSAIPVYRYYFVGDGLSGARYLYFGACGWALLLTEFIVTLWPRRAIVMAWAGALALVCVMSLELNLRSWRTAATLVDAIGAAARTGRDISQAIEDWHAAHPGPLFMEDGKPHMYEGVWVFANGLDEFVRLARK